MSDSEVRTGRSASSSARSKSGGRSRNASSSPPPRSASSTGRRKSASGERNTKRSTARSSGGGSTASGKGKGKKGSSKKKKKKKKPIAEEPKFVRDLISRCDAGDVEWVRHFLSSAEYTGKYDWNQTAGEALVAAAVKNHDTLVNMILDAGAKPDLASGKPLQRAALAGSYEAAEVLLKAGADPNCKSVWAEYVPLHYAAQVGSAPLVRLLVSNGALVDTTCNPEQSGQFNGWAALHFAADNGHLEVVGILLDSGASIDIPNSNGDTPLSIAAERGQWEVARWMVAAGANISATRRGLSVVQWGVYRGDPEAVQFLVSYGALPALNARVLWFPPNQTLKEVVYAQFSEDVYDQIDLAIYRGGKQALEREAKKKIIASVAWETLPVFDPFSFETNNSAAAIRTFPPHIVNMISSYEM